jgi:hypothetical protein
MGGLAGQVVDDLHILSPGVEDLEHILVGGQQVEQRRQVEAGRQRVDRGRLLVIADLHEAQQRVIGVLTHELGIDADDVMLLQPGDQPGECFTICDERMNLHGCPIASGCVLDKRMTLALTPRP